MNIKIRAFTCQKEKEKHKDNYDRIGYSLSKNRFAIADGVTLSFFPGIWAKLVINNFIENNIPISSLEIPFTLNEIQDEWHYLVEKEVMQPEMLCFAKNAFLTGKSGSSTFLGLEFIKDVDQILWRIFVLGDSYLFYKLDEQTDNSKNKETKCICRRIIDNLFGNKKVNNPDSKSPIINCNRINQADDHGIPNCPDYINKYKGLIIVSSKEDLKPDNKPDYLDSRNKTPIGVPVFCEGKVSKGTFYLMTDALSYWFIENQSEALEIISRWKDRESYLKSIGDLREKGKLRNDDSSILILEIEDDDIDNGIFYQELYVDDLDSLIMKE